MSKQRAIFLLGIWVAILPFLGFPNFWRKMLFIITGLLLVYVSYTLKRKTIRRRAETAPFKDNLHDI